MKNSWIFAAPLVLALVSTGAAANDADEREEEVRRQLQDTREEIRELSERLGELSLELVEGPLQALRETHIGSKARFGGPSIGAVIHSSTGERGARVMAVTPDGPAEQAGLRSGDVIIGMNGVSFVDDDDAAGKLLSQFMHDVEQGDTINIELERDGRAMSLSVEPRELDDVGVFSFSLNDHDADPFVFTNEDITDLADIAVDVGKSFEFIFADGPWSDMEVVALTPGLGDYFGVTEGLLVVRAPKDGSLDVREGDVIVRVDGDALDDRRALSRTLARRDKNETVRFEIVRQRQSMTIEAVVPEHRGHFGEDAEVFIKRFSH